MDHSAGVFASESVLPGDGDGGFPERIDGLPRPRNRLSVWPERVAWMILGACGSDSEGGLPGSLDELIARFGTSSLVV